MKRFKGKASENLSETPIDIKNITVNDPEILEQKKNALVSFGTKVHMDFEKELKQYPATPKEAFEGKLIIYGTGGDIQSDLLKEDFINQDNKLDLDIKTKSNWDGINFNPFISDEYLNINLYDKGFVQSYPGRSQEDFDKGVEELSKYYNVDKIVESNSPILDAFMRSYVPKKTKVVTINDKVIKYTHCVPTNIVIIKLTWKQKLRLVLGLKVNTIVNTYLNNGKVELTVLKIEE